MSERMKKPIEVRDMNDPAPVLIFPEHISVIFPINRTIVMDCTHGCGNGLFNLDEESFNRVMKVVGE